MFIYHFNRMIRSRILWIVFAIVIAIAFLSVDSCTRNPSGGDSEQNVNAAGTIGGEAVSYDEYEFTRQLLANSTANLSPAATETQIWAHIAAMRTAKELGLVASRGELAERILATPDFQTNGSFDRARYEQLVSRSLGMSVQRFERMQADYITLYKLMAAVTAGATASPMDIDDELSQFTDTFSLRFATVADTHGEDEIETDDAALLDYYERNKASYELPDRVSVRYAALAVTNFIDAVVFDDLDAEVQDFYESDPSRYTRRGTNGVEQLSLEEAREQVVLDLKTSEAVHIATTNLAAFMESLGDSDLETFTWRAKARGLATKDTSLFSFDTGYIPGIEAAALDEFRSEASELDDSRADARYAIARGKRNVYIMRIATNDLAHVRAFDEVSSSIKPLVVAEKRRALFDADVDKAYGALKEAMAGNGDFSTAFSNACEALSLPVSTNIAFRLASGGQDSIPHYRDIIPAALRMKTGDISDPVKTDGEAVIICLDSRTHEASADSAFEQASTRESIANQRNQAIGATYFSDWLVWNLKQKGFTSRLLSNLAAEDEDAGDDED